jgi:hypothetical protein
MLDDPGQLIDRGLQRPGVVDRGVGQTVLDFRGVLAGLPPLELLFAPAAALEDAPAANAVWSVNVDDCVAKIVPSRFQQNGRIQENRRTVARVAKSRDPTCELLANRRMNDLFQLLAAALIVRTGAEHTSAQSAAIDVTLGIEHTVAENGPDLFLDLWAGQNLMSHGVAIDHLHRKLLGNAPRDAALSGADSTDNPDHRNRAARRHGWNISNGENPAENTIRCTAGCLRALRPQVTKERRWGMRFWRVYPAESYAGCQQITGVNQDARQDFAFSLASHRCFPGPGQSLTVAAKRRPVESRCATQ